MSHKELTEALGVVHRELAQSDHLDPEDVEKLRVTIGQIQAALEQHSDREQGLSETVTHSALRFEESHPRLTETLGRIADMLQQMGI